MIRPRVFQFAVPYRRSAWVLHQETYNGFDGSRAFEGFRGSPAARSCGTAGLAFGWLSDGFRGFPSATQIIPNTLPATFNRSISTWYISYNSLKGMIVNVLIDIKITEVIKGCQVVEFPRDKFIPIIR